MNLEAIEKEPIISYEVFTSGKHVGIVTNNDVLCPLASTFGIGFGIYLCCNRHSTDHEGNNISYFTIYKKVTDKEGKDIYKIEEYQSAEDYLMNNRIGIDTIGAIYEPDNIKNVERVIREGYKRKITEIIEI